MMFQPEIETLPREELEQLQLRRLQALCRKLYAVVPFYRQRFDERGITPDHIKTLRDIRLLPFTEKQDMRNNFPFGLFATPKENIVRLHASSGTTGAATVVGYTRRDINNWANCFARGLSMAGVRSDDLVHIAFGYGLFTGGLGAHYGVERLGATAIPASGGSTKRQAQLIRDFGATAICATPSYAMHLHEAAVAQGIDFRKLPLRVGIFGAEPWTEEMRNDLAQKMGITAIDIYGLSEIMGPGVACECAEAHHGLHIQEDHFYAEIIDPETLEVLPEGETGELVLTTLTKEGIPLLRYRTHDITSIDSTPCTCGRTFARLKRFTGRTDDMLIIRGVNVYPMQIEAILMETEGLSPNYQIIVDREGTLDTMEVQVEVSADNFSDTVRDLQRREQALQHTIKEFLGVTTKVRLVEARSIERSEGKAKRVKDLRKKQA